MILKLKAFIYRLTSSFLRRGIYLSQVEEDAYIKSLGKISALSENIHRGSWQAKHGFVSVWTHKMSFLQASKAKIKNIFRIY